MSNTALTPAQTSLAERRAKLAAIAAQVDEISQTGIVAFTGAGGKFAEELTAAQAMLDLRLLLTPDVMAPIMALMNTGLGFRTDRDPNHPTQPKEPYPVEVVRDVFIESKLRGFHTMGDEFNIIAGRFYGAKAGFRRKLTDGKTFAGLTDFADFYDVPTMHGDKGATVRCRATWKLNGVAAGMERVFPIKVNSFMGSDAILGKAERKLCKAVHDRVAGVNTPDADLDDVPLAKPAKPSAPEPQFAAPNSHLPSPISDPADAPPGAEVPPAPTPNSEPKTQNAQSPIQRDLKTLRLFLKGSGHDESALLQIWRDNGVIDESLSSLEEVAQVKPSALRAACEPWAKTLALLNAAPCNAAPNS